MLLRSKVNFFKNLLKEFFSGFVVFLIPVVAFFKPHNLRELATFETHIIVESLFIVMFLLIIASIFLHFTITKIFKIQPRSIFVLCCFGFCVLFLFAPFHNFLTVAIFHQGKAVYFSVLLLFLIWLSIFASSLFFHKFNLFFCRCLIIFASINILLALFSYPKYLNEIWNSKSIKIENQDVKNIIKFEEINSIKESKLNGQNIYYIIMDSMMSLELAAKINIINEIQSKNELQQLDLTYVDQSYSSYNQSFLTIASIMEIDYPTTEITPPWTNKKSFFPMMMYQNKKSILLPNLINKLGSKFTWVGNVHRPCLEWEDQSWNCTYPDFVKKLRVLIRTIYYNTPLEKFVYYVFAEGRDLRLSYYLEYMEKSKTENNSKFVFIDLMLPHVPFNVTKNCDPRAENKNRYEGYKESYQCALKEISDFTKYISKNDPKAIIVFQGDHGFVIPEKIKTRKDKITYEELLYRASIFNAVKAPKECFKKFGKPHTSVNTVRFVLNCAHGLNLPYRETVHYRSSKDNTYSRNVFK